jgi:hypothetical protein
MAKKPVKRPSVQRQIGVALPDEMRDLLENAAKGAGHSIAEEIRKRLERTFEEESIDEDTRNLLNAIKLLAYLILFQTGRSWHEHPAAASVMRHAIDARLLRYQGGDGEAQFSPDELPTRESRFIATLPDDPRTLGAALSTVADVGDALGIKAHSFVATWEDESRGHQRKELKDEGGT